MKIVNHLNKLVRSIIKRIDQYFDSERLSTMPREIKTDLKTKELLKQLRRLYHSRKSNIAVLGGEASGKKSLIKTFEQARWFSLGTFLHINIRYFIESDRYVKNVHSLQDALDEYIEDYIISRAKAGELPGLNDRLVRGSVRIYKKPLFAFVVILIMSKLLSTMSQWSDWLINLLPNTWNSNAIRLSIMLCCVTTIFLCFLTIINSAVALWPIKWIHKITASSESNQLELSVGNDTNEGKNGQNVKSEHIRTLIYLLCKVRWQIGHTVVFENLEVLDEKGFQKIIPHLCDLNDKINNHNNSWKFWNISFFRTPMHFIYIYRDDLVQLKSMKSFFDGELRIPEKVTADNVFYELKKTFDIEVSKGAKIPTDKLFPLDPIYMSHISQHIANRRLLNIIVQNYIYEYDDFISRIQADPSVNDLHKLFSFIVYGLFFPKDRAKFASRTSIIFTGNDDVGNFEPQYRDLLEYLISEDCPKTYRIDYLCMRYVGLCPDLLEEHIQCYEQAYENHDYQTALMFIEKAICCQPENERLLNARDEILHMRNRLSA